MAEKGVVNSLNQVQKDVKEKSSDFRDDSQDATSETRNDASAQFQINNEMFIQDVQNMSREAVNFLQSSQFKQDHNSEENDISLDDSGSNLGPLQSKGVSLVEIQQQLLGIINQGEDDMSRDCSASSHLSNLDDIGKMVVVSHSLAAYVSTLETKHLRRIATQIVSDTSLWITRLFRFFDSLVYFHDEGRTGLVRICRMVLHARYPKYASEGYEALYARPPVIYISSASRPGLGQYLCTQLGLPLSCFVTVPSNTVFGSQYKMDIAALEKIILEDISAAKIPLLIVANAGTPVVGHVDNLQRLQELCKNHNIWLHVEGHSIASLALVSVPNLPARIGDSMTLYLGIWLGIPSLPCVTLYKGAEAALVHAAGLSFNLHGHLNFLPLWVVLQALGHEGVIQRIHHCFEMSDYLLEKIEGIPQLLLIGKERLKSKEGKTYSVADVISKSVSTTLLFDILAPVVVFQYIPKSNVKSSEDDEDQVRQPMKNPPYFDNLNSWLGQILTRDVPSVRLDILDLELHGVCIRVCPLESTHVSNLSREDIEDFCISLHQQLDILNATVRQKDTFYKLLENQKNLQLVEISNWAGLGGVRYIPELWVGRLNELTDSGKEEINNLNSDMVVKLKSTDSAFSLGEGDDGMLCVRFGMVTDDLDMEELVSMVLATGKELEESSKFLETMSEMVKQGIQEAHKELVQENEEKIIAEGFVRYIPIVGSVYNWWSPVAKETGIKGRSFNLQSGVVESTENIYKYHMQIQGSSPRTPPAAAKTVITPTSDQNNHSLAKNSKLNQSPTSGEPSVASNKTVVLNHEPNTALTEK